MTPLLFSNLSSTYRYLDGHAYSRLEPPLMKLSIAIHRFVLIVVLTSCFSVARAEILTTYNWVTRYNNVDIITRNQGIGTFTVANLRLVRWLNVPEQLTDVDAVIGVTEDGQVFHVAFLNIEREVRGFKKKERRTVARRLSGTLAIKDVMMTENGALVAIDHRNELLVFDQSQWQRSPVREMFVSGVTNWTFATGILAYAGATAFLSTPDPSLALFSIWTGMSSVSYALSVALMKAMQFDHLNQYTNGFHALGLYVNDIEPKVLQLERYQPSIDLASFGGSWPAGCAEGFLPRPPEEAIHRAEF